MCWFEFAKNPPVALMADEDVECYKVVKKDFKSPIMDYQYVMDERLPVINLQVFGSKITLDWGGRLYIITMGYHSYASLSFAEEMTRKDYSGIKGNIVILRCVIPKGTGYFVNNDGYVVSETVIPVSIVKEFDGKGYKQKKRIYNHVE